MVDTRIDLVLWGRFGESELEGSKGGARKGPL